MSVPSLLLAMLAGGAVFVGAGYARLSVGPARRPYYPWMVAFAACLAATGSTRAAQLIAEDPGTAVLMGKLFGTMGMLSGVLWAVVVRRMGGQQANTPWLLGFAAAQGLVGLSLWIPGFVFTGRPLRRFDLVGHPYWGAEPGGMAFLLVLSGLVMALALGWVAWDYPRDRPERRTLLVSTIIAVLLLQTTPISVAAFSWLPPLSVFAFPLLIVPVGAILAQSIENLANDLDGLVAERTVELHAKTDQLERALGRAKRAQEAQARFLANVSHELRTPLTAVLGILDLLRRNPDAGDRKELIGVAHRSGHNLLELINELLDAARIDADMVVLEPRNIELRPLLDDLIEAHTPSATNDGITLDFDIEDEVPFGFRVDPKRLRQVLHNLIGNAIKFTEEGGVFVKVVYRDGWLRFSVSDTGPGLGDVDAERLFARFSQADDSTTRVFGGTGLGLSIARDLARMMRGDLTAHERAGGGSVFELALPWVPTSGPEDPPTPVSDMVRPTFEGTVLLVDDDPTNRLVVGRILRAYGLKVEEAGDGHEAVERLKDLSADLVLMDCYMPYMDGFEATRALHREGFEAPIVALTASAGSADRQASIAAGMDGHLSKPIVMAELETVLLQHLGAQP